MPFFSTAGKKQLQDFLYHACYIHDAHVMTCQHDRARKRLTVEIVNSYHDIKAKMIFNHVQIILSTRGYEIGDCEEISSLTLEEDVTDFQKYMPKVADSPWLYLLFQMFSEDELHILCKSVYIESMKTENIMPAEPPSKVYPK